jgi:hypothetical protein
LSQLSLFAEGSPARTPPTPGAGLVLTTASGPGSGVSSSDWFVFYDPGTSSWRTRQACCGEDAGWAEFSETWPRAGLMRSGRCYRLRPWVLRISGNGSSSWHIPTPCAQDAGLGQRQNRKKQIKPGRMHSVGLVAWVQMYPTPAARDWKGRGRSGQLPNVLDGVPNPQFVEWLMGFPPGWVTNCAPSGTE